MAARAVAGVLSTARTERRLVCGLLPALNLLETDPDLVMFCLMSETRPGDATGHMHQVLLQAFCLENDIPVIQVGVFFNFVSITILYIKIHCIFGSNFMCIKQKLNRKEVYFVILCC